MRFYQGTVVNADTIETGPGFGGWVFIDWMYPGDKKVSAIKDVKRIEQKIREEGLKGWICSSERGHTTMHTTILPKMGAVKYAEDSEQLHFKREVA